MSEQFSLSIILKLFDQITAPLAKVGNAFDEMNRKYNEAGKGMRDIGRKLTYGVTLPIIGIGTAGVLAARNFENAFLDMKSIIDAPIETIKKLETELIDLSVATGYSAEGLMSMASLGAKFRLPTTELTKFATLGMNLKQALKIEDEDLRTFKQTADILQISYKDWERFGSMINEVGDKSNTTNKQLLETIRQISGTGREAGMTTAQIVALAASINEAGVEGGQAIQKLVSDLKDAADWGRGSKGEIFAAITMGGPGREKEFAQIVKTDMPKAMAMLAEGMKKIGKDGYDVKTTFEQLGFGGDRMASTFKTISLALGNTTEMTKLGNRAWDENTSIIKSVNDYLGSMDGRFKAFYNNIVRASSSIGNILEPAIFAVLDIINPLLEAFVKLPNWMQITIVAIGGFAAVIGPALIIIGHMAAGLAALSALSATLWPALAALSATLWPILAVLGAGAVGYGIGSLINKGLGSLIGAKEGEGGLGGWLGGKLFDVMNPDVAAIKSGMGKTSHEITIKLDKDLKVGDVNKKQGDAALNINSAGTMGMFSPGW